MTRALTLLLMGALLTVWPAAGATRYVAKGGRHQAPYTTWANAATAILHAVIAAAPGDTVLVSNGVWDCNTDVLKTLTIRSVAGAWATVLDGGRRGTVLFVQDPDGKTRIEGFTIQNGISSFGAGVCFNFTSSLGGSVRDCIFQNNIGNFFEFGGGGSAIYAGNGTITVERCTFIDNQNLYVGDAIVVAGGTVAHVRHCEFREHNGVGVFSNWGEASLENCLVHHNISSGGTVTYADLLGCTIVSNTAKYGGVKSGGILQLANSIVYANKPSNFYNSSGEPITRALHCVSVPQLAGAGCTNAPPAFLSWAGDFRVTNSACVNTGSNIVTVADVTVVRTALFDFGSADFMTPGAWNNLTDGLAGVAYSNVIDTTGATTAWSLAIADGFDNIHTDGVVASDCYPATAQRDSFGANAPSFDIRKVAAFAVHGLAQTTLYELTFFASQDGDFELHNTLFTCNGGVFSDYLTPDDNTSNCVTMAGCTADSNGVLHVDVYAVSGGDAMLGVLQIVEGVPSYVCPLWTETDLAGTNRILYDVTDIGAYEFTSNLAPRAAISAPGLVSPTNYMYAVPYGRVGIPVTLLGTGSDSEGSITDYAWNFGDGVTTNGPALTNVVHAYASQDMFPVTLTVRDDAGAAGIATYGIQIGAAVPLAPANFAGASDAPATVHLTWQTTNNNQTGFVLERARVLYDTIVDNTDTRVTFYYDPSRGTKWSTATTFPRYYGSDYAFVNRAAGDGNAISTATYTPGLDSVGVYTVYLWYPVRNTMPRGLAVKVNAATSVTLFPDARYNGGQWYALGAFTMDAGATVVISGGGTYGVVVADAMRFVRRDGFVPVAQLGADARQCVDTTAVANVTYLYRVVATNQHGASPPSNEVFVEVLPEPLLPLLAPVALWVVCRRRLSAGRYA
jgi:hypothetical protein